MCLLQNAQHFTTVQSKTFRKKEIKNNTKNIGFKQNIIAYCYPVKLYQHRVNNISQSHTAISYNFSQFQYIVYRIKLHWLRLTPTSHWLDLVYICVCVISFTVNKPIPPSDNRQTIEQPKSAANRVLCNINSAI